MPTSTYDLISTTSVGTAVASVSISSIPGTYKHLVLVPQVTTNASEGNLTLRANAITTGYAMQSMESDKLANTTAERYNSVAYIYESINDGIMNNTAKANVRWEILDYTATDKHKTVLGKAGNNPGGLGLAITVGRIPTTSAITSLEVSAGGTNILANSIIYLYGLVG